MQINGSAPIDPPRQLLFTVHISSHQDTHTLFNPTHECGAGSRGIRFLHVFLVPKQLNQTYTITLATLRIASIHVGTRIFSFAVPSHEIQGASMDYEQLPRTALVRMLQEHDAALADAGKNGIVMSYTGRAAPWQIIRQVKPKLHRIIKKISFGEETAQSENEIWDGENLSAMVTLYKYRGQVDLVVTDPPYNTGEDFRYNDK